MPRSPSASLNTRCLLKSGPTDVSTPPGASTSTDDTPVEETPSGPDEACAPHTCPPAIPPPRCHLQHHRNNGGRQPQGMPDGRPPQLQHRNPPQPGGCREPRPAPSGPQDCHRTHPRHQKPHTQWEHRCRPPRAQGCHRKQQQQSCLKQISHPANTRTPAPTHLYNM